MANYSTLISQINAYVKQNGNKLITGQGLQTILDAMVVSLGNGFQFIGVATIETEPGTPDQNVFYLAFGPGTFINFGGEELLDGEVALFFYTGSWSAVKLDLATKTAVQALAEDLNTLAAAVQDKVDKVPGKGLSTNDFTNEMKALVQSALQSDIIKQALGSDAGAVISQAAITHILGDYALKDGYYQTLIAGLSENLIGRGSVVQMFNRRPTADTLDVGGPAAEIKALRGNSIVWNQVLSLEDFSTTTVYDVTFTKNEDGSITVNGTASADINVILYSGRVSFGSHKYLLSCSDENIGFYFNGRDNNQGSYAVNKQIVNAQSTDIYNPTLYIASGKSFTSKKIYINIFDLTLMFGEGKEPATVAEFEALYPLDYYGYNEGTIKNVTATGLLTNGFNQWDEEWEVVGGKLASKNFIPVFPNTIYYFKAGAGNTWGEGIIWYDANKEFIKVDYGVEGCYTSPTNAAFVKFRCLTTYGTTYKHDICINLSHSGYRNGEYEPYWQSLLYTRIPTMTGKKLIDGVPTGESQLIYGTDGMKGVNTDFDEAQRKKAIVRMGSVDMGTLDWSYYASAGCMYALVSGKAAGSLNMICAKYITDSMTSGTGVDEGYISASAFNNAIYIKDSAYSDAATFKAAMNGVYLVYPLATPEEYAYDDNEMTPGGELPLNYREDDFGTENKVPADTANDVSAPLVIDVAYPMNAVDILRNLPKNYISVDSQVELLEAMKSAGKIAGYTMTWDAATGKYKYTIS